MNEIWDFVCECGTGCGHIFQKDLFYGASEKRNKLELDLGKILFIISSNCQEQFGEDSKLVYSSDGYGIYIRGK